jgi:hypothetical protein
MHRETYEMLCLGIDGLWHVLRSIALQTCQQTLGVGVLIFAAKAHASHLKPAEMNQPHVCEMNPFVVQSANPQRFEQNIGGIVSRVGKNVSTSHCRSDQMMIRSLNLAMPWQSTEQ